MGIMHRVTVTEKSTGDMIANRQAMAEQEADDWFDYYELLFHDVNTHIVIKQSYDTKKKAKAVCIVH